MEHANPGIGYALDMHVPANISAQIKRLEQALVQFCYVGMSSSTLLFATIEKCLVS